MTCTHYRGQSESDSCCALFIRGPLITVGLILQSLSGEGDIKRCVYWSHKCNQASG